jgi:hypothetical protein
MPGVIPFLRHGPASYQLLNTSVTLTGGMLVVPDPANLGGILPAGPSAVNVIGVAGLDANIRTNQDMQNPANLAQQSPWIPVYYGVDIPVTYGGACDFGRLLIAGLNGSVVPYTPPDTGVPTGNLTAPTIPASGVTATNTYDDAVSVIITTGVGVITNVFVNGTQEGTGAGTYQVPANGTISMIYGTGGAPTWTWSLVGEGTAEATPSVPATNVPLTNTGGSTEQVVVTGGTMTAVTINGQIVGIGAGTYTLPNGATISMTYSAAPTWAWTPLITTFDMIVGRCTEPLGVAASGVVARARIGQLL